MYYFVYYINILPTRRSRLNSRFKKRTLCYSLTALNRASDVSAADWLSHTQVKNYRNFSRVLIRFFSVVEILVKHCGLYNKTCYCISLTLCLTKTYSISVRIFSIAVTLLINTFGFSHFTIPVSMASSRRGCNKTATHNNNKFYLTTESSLLQVGFEGAVHYHFR